MSSTEPDIEYRRDGDWVEELVITPTGANDPAVKPRYSPYRTLRLSLSDGQVANDGTDTVSVSVSVVDGIEVARGTDPENATVLDHDGTATLSIDGTDHSVSISNGSGTLNYATTQAAPATVDVQATNLDSVPAQSSDVKTIEVTSA